jgi:hypothetical protein
LSVPGKEGKEEENTGNTGNWKMDVNIKFENMVYFSMLALRFHISDSVQVHLKVIYY